MVLDPRNMSPAGSAPAAPMQIQVPLVQRQGQRWICPKCGNTPPNDRVGHPACMEIQLVNDGNITESTLGCMVCYTNFLKAVVTPLHPISDADLEKLSALRNGKGATEAQVTAEAGSDESTLAIAEGISAGAAEKVKQALGL